MPKNKHLDKDTYNYIIKKMKKLEKKLEKRRPSSLSHSEQITTAPQDNITIGSHNNEYLQNSDEPVQVSDVPEATQHHTFQVSAEVSTNEDENQHQELDESILKILGTEPSLNTFGKEIQKDLAIRYEFLATTGLTKEVRKELIESHLPPVNCKLIAAPSLNPEIKAAVSDVMVKQDKAMQERQKQIGSAIACLSEALTIILSKSDIDLNILKLLVDTGRILCDCQHNESITRRNLILAVLKKEIKDQVQLTKIDSLLFGQELADKFKTAEAAINKDKPRSNKN